MTAPAPFWAPAEGRIEHPAELDWEGGDAA
jgi:hypothetical protein